MKTADGYDIEEHPGVLVELSTMAGTHRCDGHWAGRTHLDSIFSGPCYLVRIPDSGRELITRVVVCQRCAVRLALQILELACL